MGNSDVTIAEGWRPLAPTLLIFDWGGFGSSIFQLCLPLYAWFVAQKWAITYRSKYRASFVNSGDFKGEIISDE